MVDFYVWVCYNYTMVGLQYRKRSMMNVRELIEILEQVEPTAAVYTKTSSYHACGAPVYEPVKKEDVMITDHELIIIVN